MMGTSAHNSTHLPGLIARIATGDRSAFRCLYGVLAMRVWREASRSLPHPVDSQVVTRSTFVEVWHRARYHLDDSELETNAWIATITVHHVEERLRSIGRPNLVRDDGDRHTYREFAAMIGGNGARSGPEGNRSGPYRAPP
jgi:DNA-directed RNA polymerase specialized sigma24 family protein